MAAKTRLKKAAAIRAAQSKDDCVEMIRTIGDLTRERMRLAATMNDGIAALQEQYATAAAPINDEIAALQEGIQVWCEANRDDLTNGGKVKSADFVTGIVKWRIKPPSVRVTRVLAVIDLLKRSGLSEFVRTKEEVNKDAILNEPEKVKGIGGIKIVSGDEEFIVEPHDQELAEA